MGGMDGFGEIDRGEAGYTPFHSDWEARVFALTNSVIARAGSNADEFRHAIERIHPARYLAASYYARWLDAVETILADRGIVTRAEIDARTGHPGVAPAAAARVESRRHRAKDERAKFRTGDRVRARNINPAGHTRSPRYVRGKIGVIRRDRGIYVFPDTNAHHAGEVHQHVYSVEFRARELFGETANAHDRVLIDLWEDYLEQAANPPPSAIKSKRKRNPR